MQGTMNYDRQPKRRDRSEREWVGFVPADVDAEETELTPAYDVQARHLRLVK